MICDLENQTLNYVDFHDVYEHNLRAEHITYFVAEMEGEVIGMISCHIQSLLHHAFLVAEVQEMFVFPSFRSLGVGQSLMNCVVQFAAKQGACQVEVTSRASRTNAHRFYEREGFENSHVKLVKYLK